MPDSSNMSTDDSQRPEPTTTYLSKCLLNGALRWVEPKRNQKKAKGLWKRPIKRGHSGSVKSQKNSTIGGGWSKEQPESGTRVG